MLMRGKPSVRIRFSLDGYPLPISIRACIDPAIVPVVCRAGVLSYAVHAVHAYHGIVLFTMVDEMVSRWCNVVHRWGDVVLPIVSSGNQEAPYELSAENRFTELENPFEEGVRLFEEGQIADAALCFEAEIARNPENSQVEMESTSSPAFFFLFRFCFIVRSKHDSSGPPPTGEKISCRGSCRRMPILVIFS